MKKNVILIMLFIITISCSITTVKGKEISKVVKNLISDYKSFALESDDNIVLRDEVIVQVKLNEDDFAEKTTLDPDNQDEYRKAAKEYYTYQNNKLFNNINLYNYESVYISIYSPYIEFKFSRGEYYRTENYIVNELNSNDYVEMAYIKDNIQEMASNIKDGFRIAGAYDLYESREYTGEGIVVGLLELGMVDKFHECFNPNNIHLWHQMGYDNPDSDHATLMAAYIAGNDGIAPDVTLFNICLYDTMVNEIDWLLNNGVNIINMSFGELNPTGNYGLDSAYCDYVVNTYKVTIVSSAGNYGQTHGNISNPGLGYNVITVGSVNQGGALDSFSSYQENNGPEKPTVMATGNQVASLSYGRIGSGTSCAAAVVTGLIALLMEKHPTLKTKPEMILAMIAQSADLPDINYPADNGFDESFGAGLLRYDNFENNYYNYNYILNLNGRNGVYIHTDTVYLEAGTKFRAAIAWTAYATGVVSETRFTNYDLYLENSAGEIVAYANSTNSVIELIIYNVPVSGNYKLRIKQLSAIQKPNEKVYIARGEACESVYGN